MKHNNLWSQGLILLIPKDDLCLVCNTNLSKISHFLDFISSATLEQKDTKSNQECTTDTNTNWNEYVDVEELDIL